MNKNSIVSEINAKYLKVIGFCEPCISYYDSLGNLNFIKKASKKDMLLAPDIYTAANWIWRSHEKLISVYLLSPFCRPYSFSYFIQDAKNTLDDYGNIVPTESYGSVEEAYDKGIEKALEIIMIEKVNN